MEEPENHTLHLLRKLGQDLRELSNKVDRNYNIHQRRLNGHQLALQGQTFADQCAIARFDERISALEKRTASHSRKPK
jgi:hypothetical protein